MAEMSVLHVLPSMSPERGGPVTVMAWQCSGFFKGLRQPTRATLLENGGVVVPTLLSFTAVAAPSSSRASPRRSIEGGSTSWLHWPRASVCSVPSPTCPSPASCSWFRTPC